MQEEASTDVTCSSVPLAMTSSARKKRSESTTSRFYRVDGEDHRVASFIDSTPDEKTSSHIRQSKHLPFWMWFVIAKCNGIPLRPGARPLLGTLLHTLTFGGALTYALAYTWYAVYDILSPSTPKDIPGGCIGILLVYFWCGFGFYCKDLGGRLLLHPRFLKDIRMHARTVFKLNGAVLVFVLGLLFMVANILENLDSYGTGACSPLELNPVVCSILRASSIMFCILTLVWHSLVSFIFMSVCRTHTIGLRRFIKEIEYDASLIEHHLSFTNKILPMNQDDIWQESLWIAEDDDDQEYLNFLSRSRPKMSVSKRDLNPRAAERGEISVLFSPIADNLPADRDGSEWNFLTEDREFIPVRRLLGDGEGVADDSASTPHTMSNAELMHHFWKLNCRLRFSSCALQRWYASLTSLVLLRCSTYLVRWLSHPAEMLDILQFALPLVLLVVLSTAIAEVNFEGQRVPRCVYPTEQRIKTLQYMGLNALQMSIYGFGMTHGTIVTVVFAMLVGFVSKIVITEMTKS